MNKEIAEWSVQDLIEKFRQIFFPEYQREPNLWSRVEKQRLIDSMIRRFDIASFYFYRHEDGSIDCVDGRQRIGTIMSFLGENPSGTHEEIRFKSLNEIYSDSDSNKFKTLEEKTFLEIKTLSQEPQNQTAKEFVESLLSYPLTVVMLSDSNQPEEFNLQFTRLNIGTILNSGEKLHAMVGGLRDVCFKEEGLGEHKFLKGTNIPTRRFAREQVAAQILAQVFSISDTGEYTRTRHFDLQRLFKQNSTLSNEKRELVNSVSRLLDLLAESFKESDALRNRAITVSTVLLAWTRKVEELDAAKELSKFIEYFVRQLKWQLGKGLQADQEYYYLLEFQRNISQASAESYSVEARADLLKDEFEYWVQNGELRGETDLKQKDPKRDPKRESQS